MSQRNKFIQQGLPMVILIVAGTLGLTQLIAGRQELGDARRQKRSLTVREYDMEEDYKKTMKKLKAAEGMDYDIVRIPRDPSENQEE